MVDVSGAGFRLPPVPGPGKTDGVLKPTVEVLFGTEPAELVQVLSDDRLFVSLPIHDAGSVSVTIRNLDDNGDPIVGEEVVAAGAFEFVAPSYFTGEAKESELTRLVRTLVLELRRQVIGSVAIGTHTDYDEATNAELFVAELSSIPGLVLIGPDLSENRFYSSNARGEHDVTPGDPDTEFVETREPYTVDLMFSFVGFSDRVMELLNLQSGVLEFFRRNTTLSMDRDRSDPTKGKVSYELDFAPDGEPKRSGQTNASNLVSFAGRMVIRGFDHDHFVGTEAGGTIGGVPKSEIIQRGFTSHPDTGVELDPTEQIGLSSGLVVRSIKSPGG